MKSAVLALPTVLMLALTRPASAQFSSLVPTDDGSQVYFLTQLSLASELSLNLPGTGAIYRVQAGTITRLTDPPPSLGSCGFNCPSQGNPQVSGDGNVFSYTNYVICTGGSACLYHPSTAQSWLMVGSKPYTPLTGAAQISHNGRFVYNGLGCGGTTPVSPPCVRVTDLHDLQTGVTYDSTVFPVGRRQGITDDGQILTTNSVSLFLWSPTGVRSLTTAETPVSAIVNAGATWVVYEATTKTGEWHLRALNLSSGQDNLLAKSASAFGASISNDASLVLYGAAPVGGQWTQVFVIHPDGSGQQQILNQPWGVDEAVIAGLGKQAFAATGGRIIQIDTATGAVQEVVGRTPVCMYWSFPALVPGSTVQLPGTGMADSALTGSAPLPSVLGGVRILADGVALPLASVSPTEVWFQVPWEMTPRPKATVELDYSSVFASCPAFTVPVNSRQPLFVSSPTPFTVRLSYNTGMLLAVHQDFGVLVDFNTPGRPGEVIHTYALGLGAVTPPLSTGMPTPSDRLYPLADPFECRASNLNGPPLEMTFAGLAPGMTGIYQVDIRIPSSASGNAFTIDCGTPGNPKERGGGFVPLAQGSQ